MQAGQTYGDVKRQLAMLAQEAAQKLAQAVAEADAEEQVKRVGVGYGGGCCCPWWCGL